MPQRKHTRCQCCAKRGHFRYFETMWRYGVDSPWSWVGGWMCAACAEALLDSLTSWRPGVVAWDG